MALTKISTGGVKDDAASQAIIADEAVDEARLQISNAGSNGEFLQKQSGNTGGLTWAAANQYTHPNHSGEVTSTADGAQVIASNIVDEDNLKISNAGTNGQYLQKQSGNTGGLTWADVTIPPSGNTITAVANGSIANNKAVKLDTDGKVSEIKQVVNPMESGWEIDHDVTPSTTGADSNTHEVHTIYNSTNDVAFLWDKINSGETHYLHTYEKVSGTWTHRDTESMSGIDTSSSADKPRMSGVWDTTNERLVLTYVAGGSGETIRSKVGALNTSTWAWTWGSEDQIVAGDSANRLGAVDFDTTTGRLIFVYKDGSSGYPKMKIGTVDTSDNSTDWGSAVDLGITSGSATNHRLDVTVTTGGKAIAAYSRSPDCYGNLITISSSSNTATSHGAVEFTGSSYGGGYPKVVWNTEKSKACFLYVATSDSNKLRAHIGTVSDTTLSIEDTGAPVDTGSNSPTHISLVYSSYAKGVFSLNVRSEDGGIPLMSYINMDSTQASAKSGAGTGASADISPAASHYKRFNHLAVDESDGSLLLCGNYMGTGTTHGKTRMANIKLGSQGSNLGAADVNLYMGYADQAYTNGQTATIKTYGNTVDTLSGLTTGTNYYVQKDGSLGTTKDSYFTYDLTPFAGTALSSSKLLIRDPRHSART